MIENPPKPSQEADAPPYCGRFAPSPTGPLHFGSLVAAVGSYLRARSQGGRWLVRIEDLDPPREQAGAADRVLRTLEAFGLHWDGEVLRQSARTEAYRAALRALERDGFTYRCGCSRKAAVETAAARGGRPDIYPGTCRSAPPPSHRPSAVRVRVEGGGTIAFTDGLQGPYRQSIESAVGDFVVRRRDGLFAYQLAVVVDDVAQGITEVVRGSDLLDSTPRQIHLQRLLGLSPPAYVHLPVAVDDAGEKLSKQTRATAVDPSAPLPGLWRALHFLGQEPPLELLEGDLDGLWRWALDNWRLEAVPRCLAIPAETATGPNAVEARQAAIPPLKS